MKRVYFEVSAINRAVDEGRSAGLLHQHLVSCGQTPVVGLHAIYELARTFLNPQSIDRGKALFQFVSELDPSYAPPVDNLLNQEVAKLRSGAAILPFLDHLNQAAARVEVARLAAGDFDARARRFLALREQEIQRNHPQMMKVYIRYIQEFKQRNPEKLSGIRSFEHVRHYFDPRLPEIIRAILRGGVTHTEARELKERLNSFSALRSTVNANLFLMFVCITQGAVPRVDKIDDHRHFIEASYCDAIIVQDDQLRRNAKRINPDIKVLSLTELP
jgi:hypothetical protein